ERRDTAGGSPPAKVRAGPGAGGKDTPPADGLAGLDDSQAEPGVAAKPVVDRGKRGLIEPRLESEAERPDEHEEKKEIAVRERQQDEAEPREQGADDQHHPDVEAVDEIANQRSAERGLEPRQRERQRGGGAAQIELGEDREEIHCEPGVEQPALPCLLATPNPHET